jgi:hypothetical protein
VKWVMGTASPYNNTIPLTGGAPSMNCSKRARPMLIVSGGRPVYLTTGAGYGDGTASTGRDHTFTSMQQIQPGE